jgi:hypothetical protein
MDLLSKWHWRLYRPFLGSKEGRTGPATKSKLDKVFQAKLGYKSVVDVLLKRAWPQTSGPVHPQYASRCVGALGKDQHMEAR